MSDAYLVMAWPGGQDPCQYPVCVYLDRESALEHATKANSKAKEAGIHYECRGPLPKLEDVRKCMGDLDTFVSTWSRLDYTVEKVPRGASK